MKIRIVLTRGMPSNRQWEISLKNCVRRYSREMYSYMTQTKNSNQGFMSTDQWKVFVKEKEDGETSMILPVQRFLVGQISILVSIW